MRLASLPCSLDPIPITQISLSYPTTTAILQIPRFIPVSTVVAVAKPPCARSNRSRKTAFPLLFLVVFVLLSMQSASLTGATTSHVRDSSRSRYHLLLMMTLVMTLLILLAPLTPKLLQSHRSLHFDLTPQKPLTLHLISVSILHPRNVSTRAF